MDISITNSSLMSAATLVVGIFGREIVRVAAKRFTNGKENVNGYVNGKVDESLRMRISFEDILDKKVVPILNDINDGITKLVTIAEMRN